MSSTSTGFGNSNESLPDASGCAKEILHKLKVRCKAVPEKVRTFAMKTKAFAKRAHVKRARKRLSGKGEENESAYSDKGIEAFAVVKDVQLIVEQPKHAVHQLSKSGVNKCPEMQPHEIMAEHVSEKVGNENVMGMRNSMDVEEYALTTQQECCEEEITTEPTAQYSAEVSEDFGTTTTAGEHRNVMREDEHGLRLEAWTTSYYEVTGFQDDNITAEDVEEILAYMPKHLENSLWRKTDVLLDSFEELYGQRGDRYTFDMNAQEAKAPGFGGSPGESGASDSRESYSAYEHSSSTKPDDGDVAMATRDVKGKAPDKRERTESLDISFSGDSDVDDNSKVLVNHVRRADESKQIPFVGSQVSVLHVHYANEKSCAENEEKNYTVLRGIGLIVVAVGSGLLIGHWF